MNAEQKARELLAEEYERDGNDDWAELVMGGATCAPEAAALRAITRALQQRPSEEEVEAAAIAICNIQRPAHIWDYLPESVKDDYRRMARAALGVE